jgi:hypothetical protein
MPIKNNDDVMHLLEATGGANSSYREFDNPADHASAPLIDAVFAKGPPEPAPQHHQPLPAGQAKVDLLSEVFDRPAPAPHLEAPQPAPPASTTPRAATLAEVRTATGGGLRRTLDDIRRVITRPADESAKVPPTDSLNGLFDRLAG